MLALTLAAAAAAGPKGFTVTDAILGSGPDALNMTVLANRDTGEKFGIVSQSGGKTEFLVLRSKKTGKLRNVLRTHDNNATAVRLASHYAGSQLLPFANRIANGTYSFFGKTYHLPRNECPSGGVPRCDALHGFLFNRSLTILRSEAGATFASVTLGYDFDGSTPGWPFRAKVEVTYALTACSRDCPGAGVAFITTKVTNMEEAKALPFYNSWHPYINVADVSKARVRFDTCGASSGGGGGGGGGGSWSSANSSTNAAALASATGWRHITMPQGAPRGGSLIPTGHSSPWQPDWRIGGTAQTPTYMDDEFVSTSPVIAFRHCPDPMNFEQEIIDEGGDGDAIVLFADRQHRVWQIFTGAKEGWGWDAIALEPMSGLADAFNNGDGLKVLSAGEVFEGTFGMTQR
jgi:galactose mutarotase-like enzyme